MMDPNITAALTGLGVLIVFSIIAKIQQARLNKLEEKKVDKELYEANIKSFAADLKRGTDKFVKIEGDIENIKEVNSTQATTLELIQQQVGFLAEKNGFVKT